MILILALATTAAAQAQTTPRLAGEIELDVLRGTIVADMCLLDITPADTARFVLHRGLNVKRVRAADGRALTYTTAPEPHGVGLRYAVPFPVDTTSAAEGRGLCVEYTGAFPVYDVAAGDYRAADGSGVIAFNGRTMRARGEARWYPAPYDAAADMTQESLPFELRVRCTSCTRIYVNGAAPQDGPRAVLSSTIPRELVIYAGDFPLARHAGTLFLGEDVAPDTAVLFVQQLAQVQNFYAEFLGVPYGPPPDILRIIPVRVDRFGQLWGFFSDPALGIVGLTVGQFVEILGDTLHPARPVILGFLAHELAHRFFAGSLAGPHNQLFSEPFATFLDLQATRHFYGDAAWRGRIEELHRRVMEGPALPAPDEADARTLASDAYRYAYAPLLLLSLELHIGRDRMRDVLRALITAPPAEQAASDYALLRRSALRAGVPDADWQQWETRCMRPPLEQNPCLRELPARL